MLNDTGLLHKCKYKHTKPSQRKKIRTNAGGYGLEATPIHLPLSYRGSLLPSKCTTLNCAPFKSTNATPIRSRETLYISRQNSQQSLFSSLPIRPIKTPIPKPHISQRSAGLPVPCADPLGAQRTRLRVSPPLVLSLKDVRSPQQRRQRLYRRHPDVSTVARILAPRHVTGRGPSELFRRRPHCAHRRIHERTRQMRAAGQQSCQHARPQAETGTGRRTRCRARRGSWRGRRRGREQPDQRAQD